MSKKSSSWRIPTAQNCQKYGLKALPDDFEPTKEEKMLLDAYEYVNRLQRTADRLKTDAAMKKLKDRNDEFMKKKIKKRRTNKAVAGSGVGTDDEGSDSDHDNHDKEDGPAGNHEEQLESLRAEIESAKEAARKEDRSELIATHLATQDTDTAEVPRSLKRKSRGHEEEATSQSLISNLKSAKTPPHEFSQTMDLQGGVTLFPKNLEDTKWTPPEGVFSPNDGAFCAHLEGLNVSTTSSEESSNTLAIKFMAPAEAKRFSVNIAVDEDSINEDVLFHFNPRQRERGGQLVINDKQTGTWGQSVTVPLSQVPPIFGQTSCTLVIQIHGEGFDVFVNDKHCARLEHRQALPSTEKLLLQLPSTDDYGNPESWTVYRIWWGYRSLMATGDVSGVVGVNQFDSIHPRKLFVSGLSKLLSDSDVSRRRAEFERAFAKYGGERGVVQVVVPQNATFAFIEMETEALAQAALDEMGSTYRLSKARRTRHEALQEDRDAKATAGW